MQLPNASVMRLCLVTKPVSGVRLFCCCAWSRKKMRIAVMSQLSLIMYNVASCTCVSHQNKRHPTWRDCEVVTNLAKGAARDARRVVQAHEMCNGLLAIGSRPTLTWFESYITTAPWCNCCGVTGSQAEPTGSLAKPTAASREVELVAVTVLSLCRHELRDRTCHSLIWLSILFCSLHIANAFGGKPPATIKFFCFVANLCHWAPKLAARLQISGCDL